eukprot:Nitzschia sp. Nitz4//scaffold1_size375055//34020//34847//NITZ4_000216-RA/size375055-processed-gene-0.408-mRNA-1//-1//CDS//3329540865//1344//frame0
MKYLENEKFTELTTELTDALIGKNSHRVINGRIEAYSMKRAGNDKKFAHALGQKYVAEIEELQQELADTVQRRKRSLSTTSVYEAQTKRPKGIRQRSQSFDFTLDSANPNTTLGDFSELATRRLMTDLILTLNASFPDYDFCSIKPSQFEKLDVETVRMRIFERLSELASQKVQEDWLMEMWTAINDVVELKECDVYKFEEDLDEGALWSFHYFFVNKSLRRIVLFTCSERLDEQSRVEAVNTEAVSFYAADNPAVDDFDWDPSSSMSFPVSAVP